MCSASLVEIDVASTDLTNDLTAQEVELIAERLVPAVRGGKELVDISARLARQLLATMKLLAESDDALASSADWSAQLRAENDRLIQMNESLRQALTIIDMQALNVMQDDVPPRGAILRCGWVHEKCKEALNSNEYPSECPDADA